MSSTFEVAKKFFAESKYAEAKNLFSEALLVAQAKGDADLAKSVNLWIRKCDTHLTDTSSTATATPPAPVPAAPPAAQLPSDIRFEWFQSASKLTLTFYVKHRSKEDVTVVLDGRSVDVTIVLDKENNRTYAHHIESLFADVDPNPTLEVKSMKVEATFTKKTVYTWPTLEGSGAALAAPETAYPATQKNLPYPNSKGKDWNKVALDEPKEEGEDKPSGDQALTALFRQIYGNASDEQRRAMVKSYTESNGTVLSTNWQDVGNKHVKGEAPKGMEMKPVNE